MFCKAVDCPETCCRMPLFLSIARSKTEALRGCHSTTKLTAYQDLTCLRYLTLHLVLPEPGHTSIPGEQQFGANHLNRPCGSDCMGRCQAQKDSKSITASCLLPLRSIVRSTASQDMPVESILKLFRACKLPALHNTCARFLRRSLRYQPESTARLLEQLLSQKPCHLLRSSTTFGQATLAMHAHTGTSNQSNWHSMRWRQGNSCIGRMSAA